MPFVPQCRPLCSRVVALRFRFRLRFAGRLNTDLREQALGESII